MESVWRGQGAGNLLANYHAAQRRGDHDIDARVGKECRQRLAQFFGKAGVLQDQRALDVGITVPPAGQFEMAVADGSSGLKQLKEFFARKHASLCYRRS